MKIVIREQKQSLNEHWPMYHKWEFLKAGCESPLIIIGIETPPIQHQAQNYQSPTWDVTYIVHPYKTPKSKVLRFLKFQWLKLRVALNLIK